MNIIEELRWRELIVQESNPQGIEAYLARGGQKVYVGFDPTANSLHIGSLVPLLALRRFQLAGHRPVALLGGGTGLIGDPSGKTAERQLNTRDTVAEYTAGIRAQILRVLDAEGPCGAIVENNLDWLGSMTLIDYLRDLGKYFSVNTMLARDSVKSRLERENVGISYTEFSYILLQAYDFLHLYEAHGCAMQAGGSDQWGNMTGGIDLVRRKHATEAFCLTFPLVTAASGTKFGKTEQGTIWLDRGRTSPYALYQYLLNVEDADVARFLRYFTLLTRAQIDELALAVVERPQAREAQRKLAWSVTELLHGASDADLAVRASDALFGKGDLRSLDAATLAMALESAPRISLAPGAELPPLSQLLVESGLVDSKGKARQAVKEGGVSLNDRKASDAEARPADDDFLHGEYLVLRRGKKSFAVVHRVP
jgi:tyrosyl-tRNA synthetase